jgi:alpha-beta hydrolase superfamily lysophospholipase
MQKSVKPWLAVMCVVAVLGLTSCDVGVRDHATKLNGDFSGSGPGTLHGAETLSNIDVRLEAATSLAARITYISSSGVDDIPHDVTGAVFVPRGQSPNGGWPIVAFGHPPTGIQHDCAPSLSPTLDNSSRTVTALLNAGYVVAMTDYQGLGLDKTYHPYLDSTTVGLNLLDSVRATRKLVPNTSDRFVAFGISQGGQAAWAANELVDSVPAGLHLLGAVSVSPTANIQGLADVAVAGQLTRDQKLALTAYLASLKKEYDDFNLDDYRRGVVADKWDLLLACDGSAVGERTVAADQVTGDDLRPSSPAAADTLRGFLQKTNLPQGPAAAPMLVIYEDEDPLIDPLIPAAWTDQAVARACQMGDIVEVARQPQVLGFADPPDDGGFDFATPTALAWIKDRFNGEPVSNGCPSLTALPASTQ